MPNTGIKRGLDIHLLKPKTGVNRCPNGSLVNLGKAQDALTNLVVCLRKMQNFVFKTIEQEAGSLYRDLQE